METKNMTREICKEIAKRLNIGPEGQLDNFMDKVHTSVTNTIRTKNQALTHAENDYTGKMAGLQDALNDAKTALDEALHTVEMNQIKSAVDKTAYVSVYLRRLDEAEDAVTAIEKDMATAKERYEALVAEENAEIARLKRRLEQVK